MIQQQQQQQENSTRFKAKYLFVCLLKKKNTFDPIKN